jgi:hypothetical protein
MATSLCNVLGVCPASVSVSYQRRSPVAAASACRVTAPLRLSERRPGQGRRAIKVHSAAAPPTTSTAKAEVVDVSDQVCADSVLGTG